MSRIRRLSTSLGAFALVAACADEPFTGVDTEALHGHEPANGGGADPASPSSLAGASPACELPDTIADASAQSFVPEGVFALGHVDAQAYAATPLAALLTSAQEQTALSSAMRACDLPTASITSLDFGLRSPTETVIVVGARGVGRANTLECLHRQLADSEGAAPWSFDAQSCPPALHAEDGRVHAYPAGPDRLVVVTGGWSKEVAARVRGEGRAAVEGPISAIVTQVDRSSAMWAVAQVPAQADSLLAGTPLAGMKHATMSVKLGDGLAARMELAFADEPRAKGWSAEASATLDELTSRIDAADLPRSLSRAAAVDLDGERVELALELDAAELASLIALTEPDAGPRLQALLGGSTEPPAKVVAAAPPMPDRTGSPKGDVYAHACRHDDADSCFQLAAMYARGQEFAADGTQAVSLYQRACRLGHGQACDLVGS